MRAGRAWPESFGARAWSYRCGNDVRLAIIAREHCVGLIVADEVAARGIYAHGAADAIADVGQMTEGRRAGADGDLGVQQFLIAGADRLEEVLHMRLGIPGLLICGLLVHHLLILLGAAGAGAA